MLPYGSDKFTVVDQLKKSKIKLIITASSHFTYSDWAIEKLF